MVDCKTPVLDPQSSEQIPSMFEELLNSQTDITFPSPFFDLLVVMSGYERYHLSVTKDNQVGITHHPDMSHSVREGDELVGLLGI